MTEISWLKRSCVRGLLRANFSVNAGGRERGGLRIEGEEGEGGGRGVFEAIE